jgi:2,3-bisphosphoglycerate-dependent phosphoglycerate mutase
MAILVLVRHGQSSYNLSNLFTGSLDVPLTQLGLTEAKLAGEKLKEISFNIAYTSMLIRAQQTLEIILEEIAQKTIPVIRTAAFNERMYGSLQGLNKVEVAEKYGAEQVQLWRRSYDVRPPGGESLEDTFNRAVPYYKLKIEPALEAGQNVLIVAHGNSLRALMMYLEAISIAGITDLNIPTGVPRVYTLNAGLKIEQVCYV